MMDAVRIVEDLMEQKVFSKATVNQLCSKETTDYDKGVVKGRMEAFTMLIRALTEHKVKNENSSIRK